MKKLVLVFLFLIVLSLTIVYAGELKVTDEHPFLINNSWIEASKLKVGDLLTTIDGKKARITNIKDIEKNVSVYNLEDDYFHNYIATNDNLIVHNSNLPEGVGAMSYKPILCEKCVFVFKDNLELTAGTVVPFYENPANNFLALVMGPKNNKEVFAFKVNQGERVTVYRTDPSNPNIPGVRENDWILTKVNIDGTAWLEKPGTNPKTHYDSQQLLRDTFDSRLTQAVTLPKSDSNYGIPIGLDAYEYQILVPGQELIGAKNYVVPKFTIPSEAFSGHKVPWDFYRLKNRVANFYSLYKNLLWSFRQTATNPRSLPSINAGIETNLRQNYGIKTSMIEDSIISDKKLMLGGDAADGPRYTSLLKSLNIKEKAERTEIFWDGAKPVLIENAGGSVYPANLKKAAVYFPEYGLILLSNNLKILPHENAAAYFTMSSKVMGELFSHVLERKLINDYFGSEMPVTFVVGKKYSQVELDALSTDSEFMNELITRARLGKPDINCRKDTVTAVDMLNDFIKNGKCTYKPWTD